MQQKTVKKNIQGFPGGLVVTTLGFYCKRHRLDPWLGKFHLLRGVAKKKVYSGISRGKAELRPRQILEVSWIWYWDRLSKEV